MTDSGKKLFLLDAFALIYRAHFAFSKNPRITSKGVNSGVPFGFTNSLLEVIQKQKPTHIAVAFDTFKPTFRDKMFKEYKANRQETPEDVKSGIPLVKDIISAWNIPILEMDGYEADDIIGTISVQAEKEGFEVFMMTPDKDFSQLVTDKVFLYKPAYMGNSVDIMGIEEVKQKWNIDTVDQVRDMLGLQGDSSDNIPGIPGIGPKTASKFLKEFGTVEGLLANSDKLKGKQKENVETFSDQAILSKELATINIEVPIKYDIESLAYQGPNEEKLKSIFKELEFRTLIQRVFGEQDQKAAPDTGQISIFDSANQDQAQTDEPAFEEYQTFSSTEAQYHLINTKEDRIKLINYLKKQDQISFSTIKIGQDPIDDELVGLAFCYYPGEAYFVLLGGGDTVENILLEFKEIFENEAIKKLGHNLKYDLISLQRHGIEVRGELLDLELAHYLVDPEVSHGLSILGENFLNYKRIDLSAFTEDKKQPKDLKLINPKHLADFAGESVDLIWKLSNVISDQIKDDVLHKLYYEVEMPLLRVLKEMEFEGVKINTDTLKEMSDDFESKSRQIEKEVYEIAGQKFNLSSPKQLGEILFEKLQLVDKAKKTKSGQYATGEEILSKLAIDHPIVAQILEFREYQKLKSTYLDALPLLISPFDQRLHTVYDQSVAATGRLSSHNPNLQNIPIRTEKGRAIRKAFVPRDSDYTLMSADYSQIELRIVASFAKDEFMIESFRANKDIHKSTAAKVFKIPLEEVNDDMRRKAKEVNFGLIYGMTAFGLAERLNIPRKEAAEIIEAYFTEFSAIKKYIDYAINLARENGFVETILGRKRFLRDITSRNITTRNFAERNAVNAPIQGSAADMIKIAMVNIHQWMKSENLKSKMIMQVHDELVFDAHKSEVQMLEEKVKSLMEGALDLDVPIKVESGTGESWLEAH